ncbi:MAG: restriction endonuclease subunit S [Candidatus Lactobacillus pullistercoris]|uniref:Restriction endonuclease subunit S n=1 Tax=Candidatus Lactobacillus pullistercoris TaxID=2838636 RepID=A0A9E2NSW8_9LACO|nr:restriction endonuclease subunit S [Candidatus Lactobacillus pullistercoris]
MNKKEVKKAPILRFKGFTNDWEQRKLGTAIKIIKDKNKNQHSYRAFSISNIKGFIAQDEQFGKDNTYSKTDKSTNYIVKPGMFAYNPARINVGSIAYQNQTEPVLVSSLYEIFQTNSKIDDSFLMNWFKTSLFNRQIKRLEEGGVRQYFFIDKMKETEIKLPSISEQNQISKLLQLVNKNLDLQQRKLELLKASKKAVLQNIFTDTKRVPTIRFNTFSENWNQKRLKPFLIKYNKKATVNNQYPVLTSSRQGLFFQKDYYDGNQIASKNNIGYNIVPRNYFTYRHMSDDLIFHFNINTICDYGIVSTLYPVFTTTSEIDSQWLLYYLNHSVDIKKYALLQKQGGSRTYMYFSKLESLKAHIPALAEQKKISSLIFKIDEQIYFQQKKLKYLQKSKRFLLQNMFI